MALFVLILVGLVAAQTWLDWREARKDWIIPDWAKGLALAGVVAVSLTAATSFASTWLETSNGAQWTAGFGTSFFWLELAFLLFVLGMIVVATRMKRLRWLLVIASVAVAVAFWYGMTLLS